MLCHPAKPLKNCEPKETSPLSCECWVLCLSSEKATETRTVTTGKTKKEKSERHEKKIPSDERLKVSPPNTGVSSVAPLTKIMS